MTDATVTRELLDLIGDAFNSNDIDQVMQYFDEDAIFDHGAGKEVYGSRFEGADALRAVFTALFDNVENVHWETLNTTISGDKAYCEYLRKATLKSGEVQEFLSLDVLTFRAGLIVHKDTYYKNRTS